MPTDTSWRYIEVHYKLPSGEERWRCLVLRAPSPNAAVRYAVADTKRNHPYAEEITEYMQRQITDEKSQDIVTAMTDGTWEGWQF